MSFQKETFVQNPDLDYLKRVWKYDLIEVGSQYDIRLEERSKKYEIYKELVSALVEKDILSVKAVEQILASPELEARMRLKELEIEAKKIENLSRNWGSENWGPEIRDSGSNWGSN